jgi:NADH dehydrogenase FAD-containing subunit
MGSSNTVTAKFDKTVVIVGGSFSGLDVVWTLMDKVNILLIDKMDHFDYVLLAPRGLVKQDFIKDLTISYE